MQTFLMRHGIEVRDYTREIPAWKKLLAAVQASAEAEEDSAIELMLGKPSSSESLPLVEWETRRERI